MSEPWFDANWYAWIPGTMLGCVGGIWGALVGIFAPRGRAKGLVVGMLWMLMGIAAILLAAGLVALATGQPYGVWYGLLLPGVILPIVIGVNAPNVFRIYRQAEARQMEAHDLGG